MAPTKRSYTGGLDHDDDPMRSHKTLRLENTERLAKGSLQPARASLSGLPGEIRNTILDLAIPPWPGSCRLTPSWPTEPLISQSCRQLRTEALSIHYSKGFLLWRHGWDRRHKSIGYWKAFDAFEWVTTKQQQGELEEMRSLGLAIRFPPERLWVKKNLQARIEKAGIAVDERLLEA